MNGEAKKFGDVTKTYEDKDYLSNVVFSDEVIFYISGMVNSHNF